jgi:hypothetical protein
MKIKARHFTSAMHAVSRFVFGSVLFGAVLAAQPASVDVPAEAGLNPGLGASGWNAGRSTRMQSVINPEVLEPSMPIGAWITGLRLRHDEVEARDLVSQFDSAEVRLSTTTARADRLSTVFAENIGRDEALVYAAGNVRWTFSFRQNQANSFDAVIPFIRPFRYNPENGALLIELRLVNPSGSTSIDAHTNPPGMPDGLSLLWIDTGERPDLAVGFAQTAGLVVRLEFTPIPEPHVLLLLVQGSATLLVLLNNNRTPSKR